MIFHLALFHLELLQTETVFWVFLFKSTWGKMIRWLRGYSCSRKARRNLKLNVSGFIKDFFVLKLGIDFRELIRKSRARFGWKGFWHILFHGKILTTIWCHRKLSTFWYLGCNWGKERLRGKVKGKGKDSQKYGGTELKIKKKIFFPLFV